MIGGTSDSFPSPIACTTNTSEPSNGRASDAQEVSHARRGTMSKASRARATKRAGTMLTEMHLNETRRARELSQQALAERLGTTQPEVSRIEGRTDMYLSTLRRFVEAIGGKLVIVAEFPDGAV